MRNIRKLEEITNEDICDVLADLIDPVWKIAENFTKRKQQPKTMFELLQQLLRTNKKEVIQILAILEGIPYKDYKIKLTEFPAAIKAMLSDDDLLDFFASQGWDLRNVTFFGSVMENTTETEGKRDIFSDSGKTK